VIRNPIVGSLPQPDPVNDDPVDYIDVVATDSPTKDNGDFLELISNSYIK
jgi:hypothetical protein